jgi:hypothetical protein
MATESGRSLLRFPCAFPIKVMGRRAEGFAQSVLDTVLRHAPNFEAASMEMRPSRRGNYLGLTCTITASSREQLDALYRDLSVLPDVMMVL